MSRLHLPCGFSPQPSVFLARDQRRLSALRREYEARARAGLQVEWWDRRRLARESSLPQPAAIVSRCAAQVDAYALTHGLLTASTERGVRVFDRTAATGLRWRDSRVVVQCRGGCSITCGGVVFATGYEADALLPVRLTALHSTFAVVSEPLFARPGWPLAGCLIWDNGRPYHYFRTTADGRAIAGGLDEPFRDPRQRDALVPRKAAALVRRMRTNFPALQFDPYCAWAGTFAETADGLPFIGRHPHFPRCWFALGYGGNGITYSLIAAEAIRDGIATGQPGPDEQRFGFSRLSPAPVAPPRARKSLRLSA